MLSQLILQLPILVLREEILYLPSKNWGLNKDHYHSLDTIRHWRGIVKEEWFQDPRDRPYVLNNLQPVLHRIPAENLIHCISDPVFGDIGRRFHGDRCQRAVDLVFGHFYVYGFHKIAQLAEFLFIDPLDRIPAQRGFEDFPHRRQRYLIDNDDLFGNSRTLADGLFQAVRGSPPA